MSYDLYFYKSNEDGLKEEGLREYFAGLPYFNVTSRENGLEIFYSNEDTGVYFSFDYSNQTENDIEEPNGYYNTGLSFNINFARPTFFALEAMPFVERLSKDLNLFIINPQAEGERSTTPQQFGVEELIASWVKSNKWAVGIFRERGTVLYLPYEKSITFWKYQREKAKLQQQLGDGFYVPNILIVKNKNNELFRITTWTQAIPQVIPECDYVIIQRERKRFFGLKTQMEQGVIPYRDLMSQIGSLLEPFNGPIPDMSILCQEKSESAKKLFERLPLREYGKWEGVRVDYLVDVEADGKSTTQGNEIRI